MRSKDGGSRRYGRQLAFSFGIGIVGFFYSIFLIYAGGLTGLMITTILFAPGIVLYWYGQKERNEAFLPKTLDKVVAAAIVAFFVISIVCIATGTISVNSNVFVAQKRCARARGLPLALLR